MRQCGKGGAQARHSLGRGCVGREEARVAAVRRGRVDLKPRETKLLVHAVHEFSITTKQLINAGRAQVAGEAHGALDVGCGKLGQPHLRRESWQPGLFGPKQHSPLNPVVLQ